MTEPIRDKHPNPQSLSMQWQWGLRLLILFHFFALGMTYSANWQRSAIQDNMLSLLHPYLIGGNWYQEMLPVEWISDSIGQKTLRISIQTVDSPQSWTPALDSSVKSIDQARMQRLLHVLTELALSEDTHGLTKVLKSIVLHLEHDPVRPQQLVGIRLEKLSETFVQPESESILYEASLARFPSGEFGFVPRIESHRSVRSLDSSRGTP
ncbi:MAG: hypothetical protein NTY15_14255 [Planctomycetota bacterium]|nr:hypothetical protein [Planctomycetota bacterium]